mmetsp:Transcript_46192/g.148314  ORF Transcript_46192/g.148314 Transcript_46192/m.148314 type:complete len:152 (-) Transcript_46192:271-726(-)
MQQESRHENSDTGKHGSDDGEDEQGDKDTGSDGALHSGDRVQQDVHSFGIESTPTPRIRRKGGAAGSVGPSSTKHSAKRSSWRERKSCVGAPCIASDGYYPLDFLEPGEVSALSVARRHSPTTKQRFTDYLSRWAQRLIGSEDLINGALNL